MKDRIRQIMESQHMTQQVFAEFIGTTPATLSGIFNDRTRPTLNIVEMIKKKIPDISTDWLMFGTGSMYQQTGDPQRPVNGADIATNTGGNFSEPMIDFGSPLPPNAATNAKVQMQQQVVHNGVRMTPLNYACDDLKNIDKMKRRVTEIRVYYDDQTWESFTPSKK
ncbi:MAG: helix-turn-helix transcriptional regulator [Prevotella sp.]|nr:helix-turn-helix transcriptional regulator [Prevotella sp.]